MAGVRAKWGVVRSVVVGDRTRVFKGCGQSVLATMGPEWSGHEGGRVGVVTMGQGVGEGEEWVEGRTRGRRRTGGSLSGL